MKRAALYFSSLVAALGCASSGTPTTAAIVDLSSAKLDRGGRLFDKWWKEAGVPFSPDAKATAGTADGSGGPTSNGTLIDSDGKVVLNDAGHDYRLKNFFGWDLRGAAGIYGAAFLKKSSVRAENLIDASLDDAELLALFRDGAPGLPAWGEVLSDADLTDLVGFVAAVRGGRVARPDQVFELDAAASGRYRLRAGADSARGKKVYAEKCSTCHGADGRALLFDGGVYSLGSHARSKAYEDWFKIVAGHPGSAMTGQVPVTLSGAEQSQFVLDVLAALCDRWAFPPPDGAADVADGDLGCGEYLTAP